MLFNSLSFNVSRYPFITIFLHLINQRAGGGGTNQNNLHTHARVLIVSTLPGNFALRSLNAK